MPESQQRQLAAVMFTDIVGYTALMRSDEDAARHARSRHRGALESAVAAHHGRLIQYFGDGSLSIFPSAVDAAQAAIDIQRSLQTGSALPLRVGIHQGEIAFDEQGVYGDAVNVAARVQSLGSAGTVLVSGKVFDEIENQPTLPAKLLGEFRLKHVAQPVRVYALAAAGLQVPAIEGEAGATAGSVVPKAGRSEPSATGPALIRLLSEAFAPEYVIESQLDQGGVGLVFAARDVVLERQVAIKVVRPDLATASTVERFLREARILANLKHPNIIPVQRAGTAHGYPYYVMDLIAGETLAQRLQRGPVPPILALSIARGLLDALSVAHAVGLIHGDIQPRNMFLVGDGVVLSGFGLSGREPRSAAALAATKSSARPYRAPEQTAGALVTVRADVHAVGLVLYEMLTGRWWQPGSDPGKANWTGVPRRLIRPLRRALAPSPERRWSSAAPFQRALSAPLHVSVPVGPVVGSLALITTVVATGILLMREPSDAATIRSADLAILPFRALAPPDSTFAAHLTTMTARYLEDVPQLVVTPIETAQRWWQLTDPTGRDDPRLSSRILGAKYLVRGFVVPDRDSVEVQLVLIDSLERQFGAGRISFRVHPSDLTDAAKRVALEILRKFPAMSGELLWRGSPSMDFDALVAFLNGEQARYGGAWQRAVEHYEAALERDSLFADARWQLVNVWRWMPGRTPPLRPHLERLAAAGPADLSPLDRLLVQAQLGPAGSHRLSIYARAVALNPRDAYAALLYGEELFHRGPLAGHAADSATEWLERAAALDPNLAPIHELLAWHYIRAGDRTGARRAVERLKVLFEQPTAPEAIAYARLLEQAYLERFDSAQAIRRRAEIFGGSSPYALAQLDFAVRAGLAFHLPRVQLELGQLVAGQLALDKAWRANGHIAQALAHATLGRGAAALVHLDSAGLLDNSPEYRLMAAQWRVMPNAVGFSLMPEPERDHGLADLQLLAADSLTATRAIWSLALHAYMSGSSASGAHRHAQLLAKSADSTARRLASILDAFRLAAADSLADALRTSEAALAYDAGGDHGDPFARSMLHLARGSWLERVGDARQAQLAWVWAENTDIGPWFGGEAQAAEVDWVFGPYASYLRGMSKLESGDRKVGCAQLANALQHWSEAEAGVRPMSTTAAHAYGRHCRAN